MANTLSIVAKVKTATLAMGDMGTVMTRIEYPKGGVQKEAVSPAQQLQLQSLRKRKVKNLRTNVPMRKTSNHI